MSKRIGLLTAVFVLAFPAMAGAKIVINKSIAGVNLGEAKAGVRAHLGKPPRTSTSGGTLNWVYPGRKLLVGFKNGHVVEVFTLNPAQRTAGGIGVGSSLAAVKSHVKGVKCQHVQGFSGKECLPPVSRHGATEWTTDFHVNPQGRVSSVLVNILPAGGAVDRALARLRF